MKREGAEPVVLVATGARGSGKTSLCRALFEASESAGIPTGGLLSPDAPDGKRYELPRSGESGVLGIRLAEGDPEIPDCVAWKRFRFRRDSLAACSREILDSLAVRGGTTVIDEVGPLETESGEGLAAALDEAFAALARGDCARLVLSCRPELASGLVERVRSAAPRARLVTARVSENSRETALARALEALDLRPARTS